MAKFVKFANRPHIEVNKISCKAMVDEMSSMSSIGLVDLISTDRFSWESDAMAGPA